MGEDSEAARAHQEVSVAAVEGKSENEVRALRDQVVRGC